MIIKKEKGVALILVLTVVMLLSAVIFSLNYKVRKSLHLSSNIRNRTDLINMAESGTFLAFEILLKDSEDSDPGSVDSVHDDWANNELVESYFKELKFSTGELHVEISDEIGKININALLQNHPGSDVNSDQKKIWDNILDFVISSDRSVDKTNADSIIDCILDWIDNNDSSRMNGAESDYYREINSKYLPSNGPMRSVSELFLVKGVNKRLFNIKSFINELSGNNDKNEENEDKSSAGYDIEDYLTVFGYEDRDSDKAGFPGKININTAKLPVIISLIPTDKSRSERYYYAKSIMDYRDETNDEGSNKNNLTGTWYLNCPGCLGSGINKNIITTTSNFFKIESYAIIGIQKLTLKTYLQRYLDQKSGKWRIKILSQSII